MVRTFNMYNDNMTRIFKMNSYIMVRVLQYLL